MEEWPPIWRVTENTLTRVGLPTWGLSKVLTTSHHTNWPCYEMDTVALGPGLILSYNLTNGKGT